MKCTQSGILQYTKCKTEITRGFHWNWMHLLFCSFHRGCRKAW